MHSMNLPLNCAAGTLFMLLAGFTGVVSANEAMDGRGLREACSAQSQAGMRDCLAQHAQTSATKLSQAQAQAHHQIDQWDEDIKYRAQAKALLDAAHRSFIQYRNAHCAFSASLGGGAIGNALEMRRLACQAQLNHQRAQDLVNNTAELPVK